MKETYLQSNLRWNANTALTVQTVIVVFLAELSSRPCLRTVLKMHYAPHVNLETEKQYWLKFHRFNSTYKETSA